MLPKALLSLRARRVRACRRAQHSLTAQRLSIRVRRLWSLRCRNILFWLALCLEFRSERQSLFLNAVRIKLFKSTKQFLTLVYFIFRFFACRVVMIVVGGSIVIVRCLRLDSRSGLLTRSYENRALVAHHSLLWHSLVSMWLSYILRRFLLSIRFWLQENSSLYARLLNTRRINMTPERGRIRYVGFLFVLISSPLNFATESCSWLITHTIFSSHCRYRLIRASSLNPNDVVALSADGDVLASSEGLL